VIYILLYISFGVFTLLDLLRDAEKVKPLVFWAMVSLLILLSSIRWNVGTDWYSYTDFFNHIQSYVDQPEVNMMERGFTYLNYAVFKMGGSYTVLLTVMAITMIGLKAKVFYEHRSIMMICIFLYFCYFMGDIFGVRQFLAISITLYSVRFIEARRLKPFLICVVVAATIHITAIFFLFSYWVYHVKYSPRLLYSVLGMALIVGFMDLGGLIAKFVMNMVGIDSRVGDKLMQYGDGSSESGGASSYVSFAVGVAKRALFLPIFIGCQRFVQPVYKQKYTGYLNLLVFGNVIYLLFMLSLPVIARLSTGFLLFEIFILGYLVTAVRDKWLRLLVLILVILFGAFRLYNLIAVYWDLYIPFETIFAPTNIQRE